MGDVSEYSHHSFTEVDNDSFAHLFDFVSANSRVLDVGCSTANFAASLKDLKACDVVGIDINEADIAVARTKLGQAYVRDVTADDALAGLGTFDAMVFADVLEHLVDPRATLRAVRSALNPGGLVLFSIPNMTHLSVRLDLLAGRFPYTATGLLDNTHLHFYDRAEVEAIFADAGYEITQEKPVVIAYPPTWIAERLAELGLERDAAFDEMLQSTEADVFQFVGVATPREIPTPSSTTLRTRLFPHSEIREHADAALRRADAAQQRADAALAKAADAEKRVAALKAELSAVKASRSWRITAPLRALTGLRRR